MSLLEAARCVIIDDASPLDYNSGREIKHFQPCFELKSGATNTSVVMLGTCSIGILLLLLDQYAYVAGRSRPRLEMLPNVQLSQGEW